MIETSADGVVDDGAEVTSGVAAEQDEVATVVEASVTWIIALYVPLESYIAFTLLEVAPVISAPVHRYEYGVLPPVVDAVHRIESVLVAGMPLQVTVSGPGAACAKSAVAPQTPATMSDAMPAIFSFVICLRFILVATFVFNVPARFKAGGFQVQKECKKRGT